ncbi:MAG: hypothetical protein QW041_00035 [Candidatus Pacearchaeota archaeon]
MLIHEKENILYILENTKKAIEEKNVVLLKELSNRTIHSASIYQDINSIIIAVIIYAFYKIFARPDYDKYKDWSFFISTVNVNINKAINDLKKDKVSAFQDDLMAIRKVVEKLSGNFKRHVEEVFRRAMVSKASRIYEHGVSMERTAALLGITLFELAEYSGRTGIADVDLSITLNIEKRLQKAMGFFK